MTDTYTPNNLIAGSVMPVVKKEVTLEAHATEARELVKGTVLARKSTGKYVIVDSTESGEDEPYAVLDEDKVVAAATDKIAVAIFTGELDQAKLVFGGDDELADHEVALRKIGIFTRKVIAS